MWKKNPFLLLFIVVLCQYLYPSLRSVSKGALSVWFAVSNCIHGNWSNTSYFLFHVCTSPYLRTWFVRIYLLHHQQRLLYMILFPFHQCQDTELFGWCTQCSLLFSAYIYLKILPPMACLDTQHIPFGLCLSLWCVCVYMCLC